jgi:hypothetical protein
VTSLAVGDHNIYAVYSGNAGFTGSTSATVPERINTAYTVTAPQTPFDVTEGGSVQITVNVPPLGGAFNNVVTLSATGLPRGATASFNPPTVIPGASGQPTTLTIQLMQTGTQASSVLSRPAGTTWTTWLVGLLALLTLIVAFVRRPLPKMASALLAFAIVCAAGLALSACNAGFSGLSTPKGQYTITVTGTSGALQESTTVTVVVQ